MKLRLIGAVAGLMLPLIAFSQVAENQDDKAAKLITQKLEAARPGLKVGAVTPSAVKGIYKTTIENGPAVYSSADGQFFITGELYQLQANDLVNLTQKDMDVTRKKLMEQIKLEDMIVFAPKEGETKAIINVFTDVDCGYCQKLHREIPDYNKLGIEIRYMAFPRAGIASESYNKVVSAWCAKDPQDALTKLKMREQIPTNICESSPVAMQYNIGGQMGISGTPAIILEDGSLIAGYMPADSLAQRLGL